MDTEPITWSQLVNAPEIPENFKGAIVEKKHYFHPVNDLNQPKPSFISTLFKTKLREEECKWYVSHSTAAFLQSHGYRETALMPMEPKRCPNHLCFFYNYEITKRYGEWFLEKNGKFIFNQRTAYHILLMFFCEDENWEPLHQDLLLNQADNAELLEPSSFSVTDITKTIFGCEEIETNEEPYKKGEIAFMRALIALSLVYRPKFQDENYYNNFIRSQLDEFNKITNYGISFDSLIRKADFKEFHRLSTCPFPEMKISIYSYFFELNNLEGDFVRNAIKDFQAVSVFNFIYNFLQMQNKRRVHFDEIILKEAESYITEINKYSNILGQHLPYVELLLEDAKPYRWKNLAGVAYLYIVEILSQFKPEKYGELLNKLNKVIPNVDKKLYASSNGQQHEIYKQFENLKDVHDNMKNIPWNKTISNYKHGFNLIKQLINDEFY